MADPKNLENQKKDELFWLFPVLLVVAIIAISIFVKPGTFGRGTPGVKSTGPLPKGAPQGGQVSGYQAEVFPVILGEHDGTGLRTADQLVELLSEDLYQGEGPFDSTGTWTESTEPGPGLKIVFKSDQGETGNSDIYMTDETGYKVTRLTTWPSAESFPCITGDGKRVYFVSDRDDDPNNPNPFAKNTEIYYIDLVVFEEKGAFEPIRLSFNNTTDYGVSVSSDSTKMVFMAADKNDPDNPKMYIADGDCNDPFLIADTRLHNCVPKMSGDGKYVIYNSFFDGDMDIYKYDIEKKFHVNITNSDIPEFYPTVNYDASVIVYEKLLMGGPQHEDYYELFVVNGDGTNERQITKDRFADSFPSVSDDGKWIVLTTKRWDFDGNNHYDEAMFYMDINGQNLKKITKDAAYQDQPDI